MRRTRENGLARVQRCRQASVQLFTKRTQIRQHQQTSGTPHFRLRYFRWHSFATCVSQTVTKATNLFHDALLLGRVWHLPSLRRLQKLPGRQRSQYPTELCLHSPGWREVAVSNPASVLAEFYFYQGETASQSATAHSVDWWQRRGGEAAEGRVRGRWRGSGVG